MNNWESLLQLIQKGNSATTQFISQVDNDNQIGPTIVALANANGGTIVIGIDLTNYHLIGTSITEEWLKNLTTTHCSPQIQFKLTEINKNDKTLISLVISPSSPKPFRYKNTCYVIDGKTIVVANNDKERSLQLETTHTISTDSAFTHLDTRPEQNPVASVSTSDEPKPMNLNSRQDQAIEFVTSNGSITNKQYRHLCGVSHKTAHYELVDLVTAGKIISKGSGRSTRYELINQL